MNLVNFKNFELKMHNPAVGKLVLWLVLSLALSLVFFREFWASLGTMLSPDWIFSEHHAAPWGVLGLCGIWLWLKRRDIRADTKFKNKNSKFNFALYTLNFTLGVGLIAAAVLMPSSRDFMVFQVLLASLGVFIILFGRAAKLPSLLLVIYGFAISFPLLIGRFAELPYATGAIKPVMWFLTGVGYPLQSAGQLVQFTSSGGESILVAITAACAGPATMAVFIALFALMTLDTPLPPKKAVGIFLFGAVGTWLQSIIRLIILMVVGYHLGESAMWTAHFWTIYILFPAWYLLFAYIYFRQSGGKSKMQKEKVRIEGGREEALKFAL